MKKGILLVFTVVAQLLAGIVAHAQTTAIFNFGSQWKYLDNGTNPGATWKDASFNDASWAADTGTFGYGDSWVTKYVNACGTVTANPSCTNKYITTYFRKNVNIATASFDSVQISVMRDDGFVLYVNGVEVWRDNMPTGTITNASLAPAAIGGADEYTPIVKNIPISAFVDGNNVIALELHQNAGSSSDLTFNMKAMGFIRTNIISYGSAWKYLDNGSNQGTAWSASGFNDAAWATGTGYMGYGETWTNTCLNACGTVSCNPSCGTKYITTYFRKTINVIDVALFDSIRLSMYRDDGAIVYVNGVEVWRSNMPTGTITYTTLANSPAIGGVDETTAVVKSIPISSFINGTNTIAVEIHQQAASSSDLNFNMSALAILRTPAVPVTLTQGPYLQMGSQTAVNVRWRSNVASKSRVMVGTVYGIYPTVVNDAALLTEHDIRVTGLMPDTKYYYRFGTDTSVLQGDTANFFVTAPTDTGTRRVTIAVFGDCGRNDNSFQSGSLTAYQNYLASKGMKAADIMQLVGDNAYNSGTQSEFSSSFFAPYQTNILKNHILFPLPGNHDYENGSAARQADHNMPYYDLFTMPTAGECGGVASGTEAYYSYDWGANVHVLSLDSYGKENSGTTRLYDTLGAQVNWIKADLAANTRKWVIVLFHHPPYTMGSHNSDGEGELVSIRQNFIKILERYGVDLLITGHSHDYERSYLLKGHFGNEASFNKAAHTTDSSSAKYDGSANSCPYTYPSGKVNHGTVYVVSGSAGADGGVQSGYPHNALPFSIDDGGMFFLDIKDNRLDAKFIRRNSTIADQFTIVKDTKVTDTIEILHGNSVNLSASWPGTYTWAPGVTTRTVTVTPTTDSLVEVKDNATGTCLVDRHYVDLQCTMPDITVSPSDITRDGCHATVTYSVSDTGRPGPVYTYAFSGATVGTGNGTGSGSVFNTGITTVTLTATNECGSSSRNFNITIQPLPTAYSVTGAGGYCPGSSGRMVGLSGSQTGVTYQLYDGAGPVGAGMSGTGAAINFGTFAASTYTVLATDDATGCTAAMAGNAVVFLHPATTSYSVTGTGNYCVGSAGQAVGLSGSQVGVNYRLYDGATAVGPFVAGTGAAFSFGVYSTITTYTVLATNTATTCSNSMAGSAIVNINPLPVLHSVTGGGNFCSGGTGVAVGLDNTDAGINYSLYNGTAIVGIPVAGSGSPISFGSMMSAGVYTVLAVNNLTGCSQGMNASATVIVDPLPVPYVVSVGGNYCAGGAGIAVDVAGSETGVDYQLYHGTSPVGSPVAGTAAAISMGMQTVAGSYMVTATNTTTGCTNAMAGMSTIGINDLPVIYSVTGGGSFCAGGTGVHVGLGGSTTGIKYQLYNGASMIGTPATGTGIPLDFGLFTAGGTYSVVATNTGTGCSNDMFGTQAIVVVPLVTPSVSIASAPGNEVCAGTAVLYSSTIANGGSSPAYDWSLNGTVVASGVSSYSVMPANGDVVSLALASSLACVTTATAASSVTMTVNPMVMPAATIAVAPGNVLCEGTPATFTVTSANGGTAPVYTWLKNSAAVGAATTYTYMPANNDLLVLSMTSNAPCRLATSVFSNSVAMDIKERYMPVVKISADPGIHIAAGQRVTFTATVTGAGPAPEYSWMVNNSVIPGATTATFTSTQLLNDDSVSVSVKGSGICGLAGFNTVKMRVQTGIDGSNYGNGSVRVVPNPTNGTFTIEGITGSATDEVVNIAVTNILGQSVYAASTIARGGNISERITLNNTLADGMYLLTVGTATGNKVFHIVLKK